MPVDASSIPTNDDLIGYAYLGNVNIPKIKADVELLIGSNVPKALEPWKVVNSQAEGPYADNTDVSQWRHIGTKLNPADLASRGVSASTLVKCKKKGPGIRLSLEGGREMASRSHGTPSLSQDDPEVKRNTMVFSVVINRMEKENPTNQLLEHFSSWHKLKKAVAWYLKLKHTLRALRAKRKELSSDFKTKEVKSKLASDPKHTLKNTFGRHSISLSDLSKAEKAIMFCQRQKYTHEMAQLEKASATGKALNKQSNIYKLDPVLDEGLLRVGGRLSRSAMLEEITSSLLCGKSIG
ncbi:hypothetical protein QQF64_034301 [Cirrhinus molitorella]|uniref:Uncharacterized protein n=1 Tax=Cirrhinus molitorella TaxID=172907 RepID=A0ABR3L5K9_9TELE